MKHGGEATTSIVTVYGDVVRRLPAHGDSPRVAPMTTFGTRLRARHAATLALFVVVVAGCGQTGTLPEQSQPSPPGPGVVLAQVVASPAEDVASALADMRDPRLPPPLINPDEIWSGGPPPDGIPALYQPRFERARDIDWLAEAEPVLAVTIGGETRAYPIQIMTWHEIANDTIGGIPVAVTYCPLCNSGVAFDRRAAGRILTFGTSGLLYNYNLVMYDWQTRSLWPQLTGQAAMGVLTGTTLAAYPIAAVAWREFRAAHPDAWVLNRNTGYQRDYGRNPYVGYDDPNSGPPPGGADARLPAKERVIGLSGPHEALAIVRATLAHDGVRAITVDGRRLIVWHRPGQASALDRGTLAGGREIGTVAVFESTVDGRTLQFAPEGDGFTDQETGSHWTVLGHATSGGLAGRDLTPYPYLDTFWFAWVAFKPNTYIAG